MEITFKELWSALKKSFVWMIIFALLLGGAFYVYNEKIATKSYSSSMEYILLAKDGAVADEEKLNNYLVVGAKCLPTLKSVLMSERTMEGVLDYIKQSHELEPDSEDFVLDGNYSARGLVGAFSFSAGDDTLVFRVSCRASSPKDARVLLHAFSEIINERSEDVLHGVFVIEQSLNPTNGYKVSPNTSQQTLLGAVLGAVLCYGAVLAVTILDTRVKQEKDLKNRFEKIPVLGQIPRID